MIESSTKRILYIGSGEPWNGGAGFLVRQNLFLGALSRIGDLHLAMFDSKIEPLPSFAKSFSALPSPGRRRVGRFGQLLADLFDETPRMFQGFDASASRFAVDSLHPERFDAVFAYRIDFAHFAGVLNHPRLILDIDDPEHLRWQRRLAMTTRVIDRRTRVDIAKLHRFEFSAVAGAKLSFVCQDNDRVGWPEGSTVEVVPNCVEVIDTPLRNCTAPVVLFIGNCSGSSVSPNVDAVLFFLAHIWPKILQAVPTAEFRLVGATSDMVKKAVAAAPRTTLLGFVDSLLDVYAEAAISIAPLRFGTGTRIKILEAFAHACPVVATIAGAEGIEAVPGREIELAGMADTFAGPCVELLNNPLLAERIGQGGHELARRRYDRRVEQDRLVKRLGDLIGGFCQETVIGEDRPADVRSKP